MSMPTCLIKEPSVIQINMHEFKKMILRVNIASNTPIVFKTSVHSTLCKIKITPHNSLSLPESQFHSKIITESFYSKNPPLQRKESFLGQITSDNMFDFSLLTFSAEINHVLWGMSEETESSLSVILTSPGTEETSRSSNYFYCCEFYWKNINHEENYITEISQDHLPINITPITLR